MRPRAEILLSLWNEMAQKMCPPSIQPADNQEELAMEFSISWDFRWGKKRIKGSIQIRF
jgi:hypothetical protein